MSLKASQNSAVNFAILGSLFVHNLNTAWANNDVYIKNFINYNIFMYHLYECYRSCSVTVVTVAIGQSTNNYLTVFL